jgi:hypothetical protein
MSHGLPSRTVSDLASHEIPAFMALKYWSLCSQIPVPEGPLESNQWHTEGGSSNPPEIPKALQNRAKPNWIVKTVKNC